MAVSAALARASARLSEAGIESARVDARVLLGHVLGVDPASLVIAGDDMLDARALAAFGAAVERRARHEPVAYITGSREFWSRNFAVTSDVLIPRPDSETLIEAALTLIPDYAARLRILDLGTGSGCLLISLLMELPEAVGLGVDASEAAIAVARQNAAAHGLRARAQFRVSDWFSNVAGSFDLIIANPPYLAAREIAGLDEDVRGFEPYGALVPREGGGEDAFGAYRAIIAGLGAHLSPGGLVIFEAGKDQAGAISALLAQAGFSPAGIFRDLAGIGRAVAARR